MNTIWLYSILSVLLVSAVSLVGVVTLAINTEKLHRWLLYLVSFSAGALLGDVFLHIFPEMSEQGFGVSEGIFVLVGILLFFVLERYIHWQHGHGKHEEEVHSMVYSTMAGDTLHNFLDGLIIAGSYTVSIPVGIATTLAVIFHEIPQEIGNFAILLHGGWTKAKALWYNFLSGLASVLGAFVVIFFIRGEAQAPTALLAIGAASFIYIALSDIIPELHREQDPKKSGRQLAWFVCGIVVMGLLLLLE